MKAIVPAAGLGTRLLPATKSQPKEMLPVGRKPILQYVIEELQSAAVHQVLIITGRRKRAIEDHFDQDPDLMKALDVSSTSEEVRESAMPEEDARFFYTRQSVQRGLGDAVLLGREFVERDSFVVALGDSLISSSRPASLLAAMMRAHKELNAAAIVAVEPVPENETHRYGIVALQNGSEASGASQMSDIIEKPDPGKAPSQLAVAARYVFSPDIFAALEQTAADKNGEIQLTDAIKQLIEQGAPVYAWPLAQNERRYDIGNFESYFKTFVDFCLADEKYGPVMREYLKTKIRDFQL